MSATIVAINLQNLLIRSRFQRTLQGEKFWTKSCASTKTTAAATTTTATTATTTTATASATIATTITKTAAAAVQSILDTH